MSFLRRPAVWRRVGGNQRSWDWKRRKVIAKPMKI
jgi:hypothetical protein